MPSIAVRRVVRVTAVAMLGLGCSEDSPLVPESPEPFLVLVLSADPPLQPDTAVSGFLVTTGSPFRSDYRPAEAFSMRRSRDGAELAWTTLDLRGPAPVDFERATFAGAGNLVLANDSDGRLGRADLTHSDSYDLDITTLGVRIRGRAQLPGRPALQFTQRNGDWVVAWSPVPFAAAYMVAAETDAPVLATGNPSDTVYQIRWDLDTRSIPARPRVKVTVLDSNLVAYLRDPSRARAGIDVGYGVFGAVSRAEVEIPRMRP